MDQRILFAFFMFALSVNINSTELLRRGPLFMSKENDFGSENIRSETSNSKSDDSITAGMLAAKIINGENAYIGTVPFIVST